MDIHKITRDRLMNISSAEQTLKTGQIMKGKILKIYPNNKAQIKLGSQNMVAQLELPLAVGERYHFRVETTRDIVHLKVIGEHLKNAAQLNSAALIKNLGLKTNRTNIKFVQDLIDQRIPFQKNDLLQAFTLLESAVNKSEAEQVLKDMIVQKLPITNSVFQALIAKSSTTLSDEFKGIVDQLRQNENLTKLQQSLLKRITKMTEPPLTHKNDVMLQIIAEATLNNHRLFEVFKVAGLIDDQVDFPTWKSQLQMLSKQYQVRPIYAFNQRLEAMDITFPTQINTAQQALQQLKSIQSNLNMTSQSIIENWESVIKSTPLSDHNVALLKQELTGKILPLLTSAQQIATSQQLTTIDTLTSDLSIFNQQTVEQIKIAQLDLRIVAQKVLNQWKSVIIDTVVNNASLSNSNQFQFKQDVIGKTMPLLTTNQSHASNQQLSLLGTQFPVQVETIEQALQHMKDIEITLRAESQSIISKWASSINETVIKNTPLLKEHFATIKQAITERIMPLLSTDQQDIVDKQMRNNPEQLRQLLTTLQTYSDEQTYIKIDHVLSMTNRQNYFSALPPQEQFLNQVREMLLFSGITYENSLMHDITKQEIQTVKSMLIQMIQQGEETVGERSQQLLHFMNGLQLQSVQEMGNFIQASMQIPGEKIAINNDLYIEFESKKTEDGQINPDYCRILFYLDLVNLKETIIDMQIQKRLVSITVFNDHDQLKSQSSVLQPMLKQGLESLGYQLSNVMIKPLQEMNRTQKSPTKQTFQNSYEGIEFRV